MLTLISLFLFLIGSQLYFLDCLLEDNLNPCSPPASEQEKS